MILLAEAVEAASSAAPMNFLMALIVGVGLSAACGFRVFVPMLGTGIAGYTGHLELTESMMWLQNPVTIAALTVATLLEVGAYYVPWIDNLMDTVATPAAITAGTIMTASMVGDVSPMLKWSLGLIAGGGAAGAVQVATTLVRGTSSATTGGLGNPIVSTGELAAASGITLLAIIAPIIIILVLCIIAYWVIKRLMKRKEANQEELVTNTPAEIPENLD